MIKIFQELDEYKDYFRVYTVDFKNTGKTVVYCFPHLCCANMGMVASS